MKSHWHYCVGKGYLSLAIVKLLSQKTVLLFVSGRCSKAFSCMKCINEGLGFTVVVPGRKKIAGYVRTEIPPCMMGSVLAFHIKGGSGAWRVHTTLLATFKHHRLVIQQ